MKFTVSFKYQSVTLKHRETKEVITYDNKAEEGVAFTYENVDESFVIAMVKGIKAKKAVDIFADESFRNEFIKSIAKSKSKDLYNKLDSGEWKIDDILVSTIIMRDVEFTKPTANARGVFVMEHNKCIG